MKTYETYKDSGIEWIGEIPTDWNVSRLRYRGKSIIGITYKPDEVSDETNGTLVLRSSNVQNGKLDFKDCVYVDKKIQESQLTKEGDILVCARNGSAHLVGKSAYIPKEWENVSFGAFMSIVRTDLDKFLFYYFNSQVFKGKKGLFATSTINQLTSNMLNNLDIPIPPTKKEQTAIANYLDIKTAEIDQLIVEKEQLVALYQEEKTALINQAVTKGINPDVKLKDSGIEWLGDVPKHWVIKRLKYIANVQTGRTPKIAGSKIDFFENGIINWYTPGDFVKGEYLSNSRRKLIDKTFEQNQVELFEEYSTYLVSIGATLGKVSLCIEKASANQQINVITFKKENINPFYGHFFILGNSEMILNEADYTTLPILNQSKLNNISFAVPEIEEQTEIVQHIEKESARIDAKIAKTKKYINLLTEYRTALISEVVTGKIKVID